MVLCHLVELQFDIVLDHDLQGDLFQKFQPCILRKDVDQTTIKPENEPRTNGEDNV